MVTLRYRNEYRIEPPFLEFLLRLTEIKLWRVPDRSATRKVPFADSTLATGTLFAVGVEFR